MTSIYARYWFSSKRSEQERAVLLLPCFAMCFKWFSQRLKSLKPHHLPSSPAARRALQTQQCDGQQGIKLCGNFYHLDMGSLRFWRFSILFRRGKGKKRVIWSLVADSEALKISGVVYIPLFCLLGMADFKTWWPSRDFEVVVSQILGFGKNHLEMFIKMHTFTPALWDVDAISLG